MAKPGLRDKIWVTFEPDCSILPWARFRSGSLHFRRHDHFYTLSNLLRILPPIFSKKQGEYSSDILGDYDRANVICSCSSYTIDQICPEHSPWSDKSNVPTCKSRNSHNSILRMKRGRKPSFNMTSLMAHARWPMTSPMLQWQVRCPNTQFQKQL